MSDLLNAVDQIKSWAKKNEAIIKLAAELERIGSIEQYEAELQKRLTKLKGDVLVQEHDLAAAQQAIEEARADGKRLSAMATEVLGKARIDAAAVEEQVSAEAAKVRAAAKAVLDAAKAEAGTIVQVARAEAAAAKDDAMASRVEADKAREAIEGYKAQLAEAKAKAREAMRGIE